MTIRRRLRNLFRDVMNPDVDLNKIEPDFIAGEVSWKYYGLCETREYVELDRRYMLSHDSELRLTEDSLTMGVIGYMGDKPVRGDTLLAQFQLSQVLCVFTDVTPSKDLRFPFKGAVTPIALKMHEGAGSEEFKRFQRPQQTRINL